MSERRVIRTPRACVSPFGTNDSLSLGCRRPAKALKIVIDAERLPNAWITVSIDDRVIAKDALPLERRWRQAIDLREFADAAWLDIGIDSESFVPKGDTHTRGVRITRLSFTK